MKKIVFITNILRQPRCIRRINDFISRGYEVKVYGFDRHGDNRILPNFEYECLGVNNNTESYFKRLLKMIKSIDELLKKEENNSLFYIFSLDVALASLLANRNIKFCYEISDLMELQVNNKLISSLLVRANRWIIKRSRLNIYTSEGFVNYLSPRGRFLEKTIILPNKLSKESEKLQEYVKNPIDIDNIRFGFTGAIRTETLYNFIDTIGKLEKHEVHLYGIFTDENNGKYSIKELVDKYRNVYYHGSFMNPHDLPKIYSNFDLVLCYYYSSRNDLYLEPNKLYEAIYYRCPIIVADGTFVGEKVKKSNIGYTISTAGKTSLIELVNSINKQNYQDKLKALELIPREWALDNPRPLFDKIEFMMNVK